MKTIIKKTVAAYESPATRILEVTPVRCILNSVNSYGANINNLNNQTYTWSDSDWDDVL